MGDSGHNKHVREELRSSKQFRAVKKEVITAQLAARRCNRDIHGRKRARERGGFNPERLLDAIVQGVQGVREIGRQRMAASLTSYERFAIFEVYLRPQPVCYVIFDRKEKTVITVLTSEQFVGAYLKRPKTFVERWIGSPNTVRALALAGIRFEDSTGKWQICS